jgi:DNA-binding transcriptional regulator LsrR (DeoR family)
MREDPREVLRVLVQMKFNEHRTTVKSSKVAERLSLKTSQVGAAMTKLRHEGYVEAWSEGTPTTWWILPDGHPRLPPEINTPEGYVSGNERGTKS